MTAGITIRLPMATTRGHHPVPTELTYTADRPLEVRIRALIPSRGWCGWVVSRDALADTFLQWSVTRGAARIAVAGRVLTMVLYLGPRHWTIVTGQSGPVFDFVQTTFDLCPPCSGCGDEFCLSCAAVGRQVDAAIHALTESRGS